jgi:hypothetical protein
MIASIKGYGFTASRPAHRSPRLRILHQANQGVSLQEASDTFFPLSPTIWTARVETALGAVHWAKAVLYNMPAECNTSLDYFVELGCGFAIKQRSDLLASFIVERTAVHRLESGLTFKLNYGGVVSSFEGLQKLSAYKALEISECLV